MLTRYDDVSAQRKAGHSADEPNLTTLPSWNSDSGTLGRHNRMMGGLGVVDQDPLDHTRLLRLLTKAFTRRLETVRRTIRVLQEPLSVSACPRATLGQHKHKPCG